MSGLYGYIGREDTSLLKKMGETLPHRKRKYGEDIHRIPLQNGLFLEFALIHSYSKNFSRFQKDENKIFAGSGIFLNNNLDVSGLSSFDGAFIGLAYTGNEFLLFRDPAGIKVVYYAQNSDRFLFSSELKALFADKKLEKKIRLSAIPEYFTYSYIPGKETMFQNIYELEAGSYVKYQFPEAFVSERYFFPEKKENFNREINLESIKNDLKITIVQNIQSFYKQSQCDIGVFLSGGIDSSAVLALAYESGLNSIPSFSVHFGNQYISENEYIELMLKRYKTDHHYLEIKPSMFLKNLSDIIYYLDEPIGDPVTVPNYLMSEYASDSVSAVFNGEGGDPCFGGPKNIPMLLSELYSDRDNVEQKARLYLYSYQRAYKSLSQLLTPDFFKEAGGEEKLISTILPFFETTEPKDFLNKLMWINIRRKGANLILPKVDKMSSANSLFAYPPLFLGNIISLSMNLPPSLKLKGNIEKWILKEVVRGFVPEEIIARPKSGMRVPVRFWFQNEMKRYAKKVLSKKRIKRQGIFNYEYIQTLLSYKENEVYASRYGLKLWMLITFFLWWDRILGEE